MKLSFLKACTTDQFNHAPAQLLVHTGSPRLGRPSLGVGLRMDWEQKIKTCPALLY